MLHSVKRNCYYDNQTLYQSCVCGRYGHQVQTIVQKSHKDCTEDRAGNGTFAAEKGNTADNGCRDNVIGEALR